MRALFDVNVLIAWLDRGHIHHERTQAFWVETKAHGWASCPLTENGFVRIVSQASYPNRFSCAQAIAGLKKATDLASHEFWPDDVSITDPSVFGEGLISGPKQLTDIYLLGLASKRGGRFVTLDRTIAISAVVGATEENLVIV